VKLHRYSAAIRIPDEMRFLMMADPRYRRLVERIDITQPTEADWAEYRKVKKAHEYLLNSPYFDDGGPDERSSVSPPEPTREYVYAETTEEWLTRCRAIEQEDS